MPTYSVYNYATKAYDYYETPGGQPTHASAPAITSMGGLGVAPEAAAWKLPVGARKVGSGEFPRGRVASMGGFDDGGVKVIALGLAALLAWRYLR